MDLLIVVNLDLNDAILAEPTIEALYYKHSAADLFIQTWTVNFPFFENHPLVSGVIPMDEDGVQSRVTEIIENSSFWPTSVEGIAASVNVPLARKTPWIHVPSRPKDENRIVIANVDNRIGWPNEIESMLHGSGAEILVLDSGDDIRRALKFMSSASLVVGPDNWATQAAAAMNLRVVISMTEDEEARRKPSNAVVTTYDLQDVLAKVREFWAEKRYPDYLNAGNMTDFIKLKAKEYMKGNFLDVGANKWPLFGATPVDIDRRSALDNAAPNSISGIYSSHCLEHIVEWQTEVRLWHKVLRPGGTLFLYLPHPQCEPWHAWTGSWVGAHHVWNPDPVTFVRFLKEDLNFHVVEYSSRPDALWSFHIVARKR